jgi:hypothetical protein
MNTDQNLAAEADNMRDDLTEIDGLGKNSAETLYQIGIQRFDNLAQYSTPAEFHQALLERGVESIPLGRIENKNREQGDWLQQARKKVQEAESEQGPPDTDNAAAVQESGQAPDQPNWIPEAGFSVIFDSVVNENGEQDRQTRVRYSRDFDPKSDYKVFPGIDPSPWVKWILEQAGLPSLAVPEVADEPTPDEYEVSAPKEETKIEIVDLQVSKSGPSSGVPEKGLMAQASFEFSGPDVEKVTTESLPFRVEIHTVDQEEGTSKLVASEKGQLQPRVLTYESEQWFPIPEDVGRYDLHCWVLLLPPGTMAAHRQGPTINRVP